jgi:hypothetical protein
MLEVGLCLVGCGLLCYTLGRYDRTATLRRWHFVLNLPARRAVAALRQQMELDLAMARQALAAATVARDAGRLEDAAAVLRAALAVLEDAGADRLTRLRAMRVYSRMVRAIQPSAPPARDQFRGRSLRLLASATVLMQRFLVGGAERFRLWLLMLRYGVRIVLHSARSSTAAVAEQPARPANWCRFEDGVEDFAALDASHLEAFEALSASLAAIETGTRLRLWDTIANP